MTIVQYMVDAFTDVVFKGNQAAVCCTEAELDVSLMQSIACENNYSETAFLVPFEASDQEEACYRLRWFTPGGEIDLCGHATLASGYVVSHLLRPGVKGVSFETRSGRLFVATQGKWLTMDMPAFDLTPVDVTDAMEEAIGARPVEAYLCRDLICVLGSEEEVRSAAPSMERVTSLPGQMLSITSKGSEADCASRSFAPKLKVNEDPVCGSAHCALAPLWGAKLGVDSILAEQASERGGMLRCFVAGNRVRISGRAALYAKAELFV